MADEENAPEGGEEGDGKAGKKKIFIIAGIVVVLLIAGGAGAWFMMSGGDEEAEAETAEVEVVVPAVTYISLGDKYVVTLQDGKRQRYLQAEISASTRNAEVVDAMAAHAPLVRAKLIELLGAQEFGALRTDEGRQALRDSLLTQVNTLLLAEGAPGEVEQIFFTDFVLQ